MIRQSVALESYLVDGRLCIDNGSVERGIRDLALGRRTFVFASSGIGAERAAVMYTLVDTCKLNGVRNIWAYLRDVLEKLAEGWPNSRLDDLLPDEWAARQTIQAPVDPASTDLIS